MSVIPEILFEYIIKEGLADARRNKTRVMQLFRGVPVKIVEQFHQALSSHDINFVLEFPRENPSFPMIWLDLLTEEEAETFIGEMIGMSHGADGMTLQDGYTYPHIQESGTLFYDSSDTTSGSVDVLGGGSVYVGEAFGVDDGIDPTTISNPVSKPIIGEPARLFDVAPEGNRVPVYENYGQGYTVSYGLTILSNDSTYVMFLYHLVKNIINRYRLVLDEHGIKNLSMSGTNFGGDPDLLPTNIYVRSINISFLYISSDIQEMDLPRGISIYVQPVVEDEVVDTITIVDANLSVTGITPSTGARGTTVTCVVDGTNIHNGATASIAGGGLTISNSMYIAGNKLQFDVTIAVSASLSARDVTITNPDGIEDTLTGGFTVTA